MNTRRGNPTSDCVQVVGQMTTNARLADPSLARVKSAQIYANGIRNALRDQDIKASVEVLNAHVLYAGLNGQMFRVNVDSAPNNVDVAHTLKTICGSGSLVSSSSGRIDSHDVTVPLPSLAFRFKYVLCDVVQIAGWLLFIVFVLACLYYVHPDFSLFYVPSQILSQFL